MRPAVTTLLDALKEGGAGARDDLFGLVYEELKRIARGTIRQQGAERLTLNPSTLVHEAFLRFAGADAATLQGSRHFYHLIAQAMRQIVLDLGRRRSAVKRGAAYVRTDLPEEVGGEGLPLEELVALDDALRHLQTCDADLAELVELHFFAGLSMPQIAMLRGVTERTVRRHWEAARLFLMDALPPTAGTALP